MSVQQLQGEQLSISERTLEWQLIAEGSESTQTVQYVAAGSPDTLVVTGFGETNTREVARTLSRRGIEAAVCSIAYPETANGRKLCLTPDIMEQTILKGLSAVTRDLREITGDAADVMVGHSKGFGELLKFVSENPDSCKRVSGAAPFGANCIPEIFGTDIRQYKQVFKERLRRSGLLSGDPHPEARRLAKEFMAGIKYVYQEDCPAIIRNLADLGILKQLIVGEDDTLCPPDECDRAVGRFVDIATVDGGHAPITSDEGMDQVVMAIKQCSAD